MRLILFFCILISVSACSLYQSDGRKAIEKNTANVVTGTGFDSVQNIKFVCYQSGSEPAETKGPIQVIDNEFDEAGIATYLIDDSQTKKLLVYRVPTQGQPQPQPHNFCHLDTLDDLTYIKIRSAIRLGVQLLSE